MPRAVDARNLPKEDRVKFHRIAWIAAAAFALATAGTPASAAPFAKHLAVDSATIQVKGGRGHGHGGFHGHRGRHHGWHGNRGLHRGWYIGRHRGWSHSRHRHYRW